MRRTTYQGKVSVTEPDTREFDSLVTNIELYTKYFVIGDEDDATVYSKKLFFPVICDMRIVWGSIEPVKLRTKYHKEKTIELANWIAEHLGYTASVEVK